MNVLLASTSTLFGGKYLEYIKPQIKDLFEGIDEILFIPFARPGGISHEDYTQKAAEFCPALRILQHGTNQAGGG